MTPGLLVRIHRINDSVEVFENSNMTFPFKGPWFAGKDVLITVAPPNIQHIVTSNVSNYIRGAEFQEIFEVCGDGIINSDADRASKLKKCYQALLHHQGFQRDSMSITTRKLNEVIASFQSFIRGRNGRGLTRCVPEIHVRHYPSYDNWV
ncbi:unnamed protein product [Brassica napus]|uniref:(rape) hypothetical protein n=1 Tax=Brassica napus TaxID=3708 RepID=A0A816IN19_BRANA|nr:unnamed protein product [Brassica napus]